MTKDWNEPRDKGPTEKTEELAEQSPSSQRHKSKRKKNPVDKDYVLSSLARAFLSAYRDDRGALREIEQTLQQYVAEEDKRFEEEKSRYPSKFTRDFFREGHERRKTQILQFCKELRSI
jgi:hypothetical protein